MTKLMSDIDALPDSAEKARFRDLCAGYWAETMELVENAWALQDKQDPARRP